MSLPAPPEKPPIPSDLETIPKTAEAFNTHRLLIDNGVALGVLSTWRFGPRERGRPTYVSVSQVADWLRSCQDPDR